MDHSGHAALHDGRQQQNVRTPLPLEDASQFTPKPRSLSCWPAPLAALRAVPTRLPSTCATAQAATSDTIRNFMFLMGELAHTSTHTAVSKGRGSRLLFGTRASLLACQSAACRAPRLFEHSSNAERFYHQHGRSALILAELQPTCQDLG